MQWYCIRCTMYRITILCGSSSQYSKRYFNFWRFPMSLLKLIPVNVGSNSLCLWGYKQNLDKVKVPERGPSKVQTEVLVKYLPQVTYVDEIRIFCLNTYFLHDIWCCFCMMFWCLWFPIVFLMKSRWLATGLCFFRLAKMTTCWRTVKEVTRP